MYVLLRLRMVPTGLEWMQSIFKFTLSCSLFHVKPLQNNRCNTKLSFTKTKKGEVYSDQSPSVLLSHDCIPENCMEDMLPRYNWRYSLALIDVNIRSPRFVHLSRMFCKNNPHLPLSLYRQHFHHLSTYFDVYQSHTHERLFFLILNPHIRHGSELFSVRVTHFDPNKLHHLPYFLNSAGNHASPR